MEDREKHNIEERIKKLDKELNAPEIAYIWMLKNGVVTDKKTIIATSGIATCVGLAIAATDSNGVVHRIVTHNPYTGERTTKETEEAISYYLQELEPIEKLEAMICSMDRFNNFNNLNEDEEEILSRINKIFQFYKEKHKDFNVPFYQSWYVKVSPQGEFEYADEKMVEVYREMEKKEMEEHRIRYEEQQKKEDYR